MTPTLDEKFDEFRATYEKDMRGDKELNNGDKGVIGEIRDLKKYIQEYPSITWLIAHKPLAALGSGLALWILFDILTVLNITRWLAGLVGIVLP